MGIFSKIKQTVKPDPDYPLIKEKREGTRYSPYPLESEYDRPERKTLSQIYLEKYESTNPDEIPPRRWDVLSDKEKKEYIQGQMRKDRKKKTSKKSMKRKPVKKCTCKKK